MASLVLRKSGMRLRMALDFRAVDRAGSDNIAVVGEHGCGHAFAAKARNASEAAFAGGVGIGAERVDAGLALDEVRGE